MIDTFTLIDDAIAIVKHPRGVFKQTAMYRRGDRVYVPHAGGFIQLLSAFDGRHSTSHPDIKIEAFDAPGVAIVKGVPVWEGGR